MGLAKLELERANRGDGCLGKAHPQEPVFILRAQDALAADIVREWAHRAEAAGCNHGKVLEALDLASDMRRWPIKKNPD